MKIVPDLNSLIEEQISKLTLQGAIDPEQIIIHEAIIHYLEDLANENKTTGMMGIQEISRISEALPIVQSGDRRPYRPEQLDGLARDLAYAEDATLITTSKIQYRLAKARGIDCIKADDMIDKPLRLETFFTDDTMSVHLRESVIPYAKVGGPGNWTFKEIGRKELEQKDVQEIAREIVEHAKIRKDGFIEIERFGSTIIQLGKFRIVITRPPFSDGWEITAVRPVKKLSLSDYEMSEKLSERLSSHAEGILIAGSPGMGKTTFAAALAEFYADNEKTVKTVEAPRDLVLPDKITQYAISHGDAQEIHDILLLSRPDYTIFDEIRNTDDFRLFSDLRLAGIGFIGVLHATQPVDAIQRFVGRIELGIIPQIIDTVVFIRNGTIDKVLGLKMVVKVPSGMKEQDLARPVVVVNGFETGKSEYEIYSYGEETVVMPVNGSDEINPLHSLAEIELMKRLKKFDVRHVEMTSDNRCKIFVPEDKISKIIGKQGKNIMELESSLGLGIDVMDAAELSSRPSDSVDFGVQISSKSITFRVKPENYNKNFDIHLDGDYLLTTKASKKGAIKVKRSNKIGKIIAKAINSGEKIILSQANSE